jgi:hypothetical protein
MPNVGRRRRGYLELPSVSVPSLATGALPIGALALGALAIGALAIGRLRIFRADADRLHLATHLPPKSFATWNTSASIKIILSAGALVKERDNARIRSPELRRSSGDP